MTLCLTDTAVSLTPFQGIGVEADCYIYDDTNRQCGVNAKDLELIERRLQALKPALARLFVSVAWVNPSLDGKTMEWGNPYYGYLVRQLKLLDAIGTRINLVLFDPQPPAISDAAPLVQAMVLLLERLRAIEGIQGLAWLTLYNEPDGMFPHDSPLVRRLFGDDRVIKQPPFEEYVRLNRLALSLLCEHGLTGIRLLVADTVWGHPMRVERLRLCRAAFADDDVDYSYHNYSDEDPAMYDGNPNWVYPGVAEESRLFREMVGADRRLMLWEFNAAGKAFGSHFPGLGSGGSDLLGGFDAGPIVCGKVMRAMQAGIEGICLWCAHDMVYMGNPNGGPMQFGLWRFKWQHWYPRPYYHYYALLCRAFRPGCVVQRIEGALPGVAALSALQAGRCVAAFLNETPEPKRITVQGPWTGTVRRLRVYPGMIPLEGDLPAASEEESTSDAAGQLVLELEGRELVVVTE